MLSLRHTAADHIERTQCGALACALGNRDPLSCRGAALTEMAILLPVLILLLLGSVDFGRGFFDALAVESAANAGAQYGGIDTVTAKDTAGIRAAVLADLGKTPGNRTVDVVVERYCNCKGGVSVACSSGSCGTSTPRTYVSVTVEMPFVTMLDYPGIPHSMILRRTALQRAR